MNKTNITLLAVASFVTVSASTDKEECMLREWYNGKKVLVTGGAGFIGSHIAQALVDLGAQVTVLDNFSTGSKENIAHLQDNLTVIESSITNFDSCLRATQNQEVIFHLAAFVSVPQSVENPSMCHETNVNGTFNLLEAAKINRVKRFVFSSSCSVYGEYEGICSEDVQEHPLSPYATSKLIGELLCKQYISFNVPCVILRYFNVYGPRQNPHAPYAAAIAKFTYQMERNEPITIFGDGTQTRDFVPVTEVARTNLITGMLAEEQVVGQIINVGSGRSVSVLELIDSLKKQFPHYTGAVHFAPARPGDVKHVRSCCKRLEHVLSLVN